MKCPRKQNCCTSRHKAAALTVCFEKSTKRLAPDPMNESNLHVETSHYAERQALSFLPNALLSALTKTECMLMPLPTSEDAGSLAQPSLTRCDRRRLTTLYPLLHVRHSDTIWRLGQCASANSIQSYTHQFKAVQSIQNTLKRKAGSVRNYRKSLQIGSVSSMQLL